MRAESGFLALACTLALCLGTAVVAQDVKRYEECPDPLGAAMLAEARDHLAAGRLQDALPLLARVVERCPECVPAHLLYQDTALRLGGAAVEALRRDYERLQDPPKSVVVSYARIRLLPTSYDRLKALDAVIRRDKGFWYAHHSKARQLRNAGLLAGALDSWRNAVSANPDFLPAWREMGEVHAELGNTSEACRAYENYLRGAPDDAEAVASYVHLLVYKAGRPAEAFPWIQRLVDRDPLKPEYGMDRAAALWLTGKPREALDLYLGVLEREPLASRAALNIGFLCYEALAGGNDAGRLRWWPVAREAMRYYLKLVRAEDAVDFMERYFAVPFRLEEIDAFLVRNKVSPAEAETSIETLRALIRG
ncbi:MAG: hypothetical protein RIT25_411 [Planctomycetota bacterium]